MLIITNLYYSQPWRKKCALVVDGHAVPTTISNCVRLNSCHFIMAEGVFQESPFPLKGLLVVNGSYIILFLVWSQYFHIIFVPPECRY